MTEAPSYLCNAVIILTAHKLGKDVDGVSLAQQVWADKSLPEPHVISMLAKSANTARERVCIAGLAKDADRIAEEMFTTESIRWNQHHVIVGNAHSSKMKIFAASATAKYPTASVVVETNASSDSTEWRDTMQNASYTITRGGDEARSANNLIRSLSAKQWTWQ